MPIYEWINLQEVKELSCHRIILFGAGKGAEEFLEFLQSNGFSITVLGIIDNDRSLWGRKLSDIPITGISDLSLFDFEKIVVTSISGRDAIAQQLERKGYRYPDDYILIGKFPVGWKNSYLKLRSVLVDRGGMVGKKCLHIGPGGFLGLEVLLYCFGAVSVSSIDKFAFGIHYPDVTERLDDYMDIKKQLGIFASSLDTIEQAEKRFCDLFVNMNGRVCINPERISYLYPEDICSLPFPDNNFDIVASFGVLEHVEAPEQAANEISRVLKPGGISFHSIITADHRSFSRFDAFDAFSFRSYSSKEWDDISSQKFYQNRVIPVQWKQLFEGVGLDVEDFTVGTIMEIDARQMDSFSEEFESFSMEELGEVNCDIMLKK